MTVLTQILITIMFVVIIAFFVILAVMTVIKSIAKSKKFVQIALTQVLKKKCANRPNSTFCLQDKEGNLLTVKYLPRKEVK